MESPAISIVAPAYNEARNIAEFVKTLTPILDGLGEPWEIVFVDDGSRDETLGLLIAARSQDPRIKIIGLARNFGKDIALSAGLAHARGKAVIPIDTDLQHPPELIPEMVAKWKAGAEMVIGVRSKRTEEGFLRRTFARWYYGLMKRMTHVEIPPNAGDFRLLDRKIVDVIIAMPERTRFMKGIFAWPGFKTEAVEFQANVRAGGQSKWSLFKLWRFALDGLFSFSTAPLKWWTYIGGLSAAAAFVYGAITIVQKLAFGIAAPGYASLLIVMLFTNGLLLLSNGIQGEYIARIFEEVKGRPLYVVGKKWGFDEPSSAVKRPLLAWAAVIVPLWVTMILCTHWEPVTRDGWGHVAWHLDHNVTPGELWAVLRDGWLGSNPRFGQTLTYILFAPGPLHSIVTPIVVLGMFYTLATLALGRWPSLRRADDALCFATVFAIAAICTPEFGSMLFYRPYVGNYVFGLAFNALWLVPYRLQFERARTPRWWWAPGLFVLGLAAGNCNEHTGPAVLIAAALAVAMIVRRRDRARAWMIAGIVGMLAGYLLLIFAPGQHERYNHLAEAQRTMSLIAERGLGGNLRIVFEPLLYLLQAIPWILVGRIHRGEPMPSLRKQGAYGALVVAAISVLVLLGSPKIGPRLYLATTCLGAVAIASWVVLSPARRALAWLAGVAIAFVCIRCLMVYGAIGAPGAARKAAMLAAKPGDKLVFPRYADGQHWFDRDPLGHNRWFIGDDFAAAGQRDSLAGNWHVTIELVDP